MAKTNEVSLKEILEDAARLLKTEFQEIRNNNPHYGDAGSEAEDILKRFLKDRVPKRFDVESGFVVGLDETISLQTDLIVFDALHCPLYRRTKQACIVPRDNVAAVIEVKSKLDKAELRDAAEKIAAAKRTKTSEIGSLDKPVNYANVAMTNLFGCVFAYESATSLETLADNLKEINSSIDSSHWIDMIVVLDKGTVTYTIQFPMTGKFSGWFGGALANPTTVPPVYVHLTVDASELALNQFYVRLVSHLSIFRQKSNIPFDAALGKGPRTTKTLQGYQYNLAGKLVPVEETHQSKTFQNPTVRFNLYDASTGIYVGQVCRWLWQDGAAVTYSGRIDPSLVFMWLSAKLATALSYFLPIADQGALWCSNVTAISEEKFVEAVNGLPPVVVSRRDSADDEPPPMRIQVRPNSEPSKSSSPNKKKRDRKRR